MARQVLSWLQILFLKIFAVIFDMFFNPTQGIWSDQGQGHKGVIPKGPPVL